ncbi:tetratricopeptide repeat protein, partial [Listeria monocytogenes]|uniref:hypothetical protein n=1 Tax=Listeria monocytogenes TaxID=1639 RepID=UPI002FDBBDDE
FAGALAEHVLQERPKDLDALAVKAALALDQGEYDAALATYDRAIAAGAGAAIEGQRARLLADAGELDDALRALERIAQVENDDASWSAL